MISSNFHSFNLTDHNGYASPLNQRRSNVRPTNHSEIYGRRGFSYLDRAPNENGIVNKNRDTSTLQRFASQPELYASPTKDTYQDNPIPDHGTDMLPYHDPKPWTYSGKYLPSNPHAVSPRSDMSEKGIQADRKSGINGTPNKEMAFERKLNHNASSSPNTSYQPQPSKAGRQKPFDANADISFPGNFMSNDPALQKFKNRSQAVPRFSTTKSEDLAFSFNPSSPETSDPSRRSNTPMSNPGNSSRWKPPLLPDRFEPRSFPPIQNSLNSNTVNANTIDDSFRSQRENGSVYLPNGKTRSLSQLSMQNNMPQNSPNYKLTQPVSSQFYLRADRNKSLDPLRDNKVRNSGTHGYSNMFGVVPVEPDNWSLSNLSPTGSENERMVGVTSNASGSFASDNSYERPGVAPPNIARLVSHLKNIPKVPGPEQNLAFKRNQEMSQALHSIQHVDKFRTDSLSRITKGKFPNGKSNGSESNQDNFYENQDSASKKTPRDGQEQKPSPENHEYSLSAMQRNRHETSANNDKPSNGSVKWAKLPSNGDLLKRYDDGSQDIEIYRPGHGQSFGFCVYKEDPKGALDKQYTNLSAPSDGGIYVSRLKDDRFGGLVNVGDRVLKVNGNYASEMTLDELENLIVNSGDSVILTTLPYLVSVQKN